MAEKIYKILQRYKNYIDDHYLTLDRLSDKIVENYNSLSGIENNIMPYLTESRVFEIANSIKAGTYTLSPFIAYLYETKEEFLKMTVSGLMVARAKDSVYSVLFPILVFRDANTCFRFFSVIPGVAKIPRKHQLFLFLIAKVFCALLLARVAVVLFHLFMEELSSVAQFCPSISGGMSAGSSPPPGPSGDPSFIPIPYGTEGDDNSTSSSSFFRGLSPFFNPDRGEEINSITSQGVVDQDSIWRQLDAQEQEAAGAPGEPAPGVVIGEAEQLKITVNEELSSYLSQYTKIKPKYNFLTKVEEELQIKGSDVPRLNRIKNVISTLRQFQMKNGTEAARHLKASMKEWDADRAKRPYLHF